MMTYNQYLELPDDGSRYEIIEGQLHLMTSSLGVRHQSISRRFTIAFDFSCKQNGVFWAAPIDVILSDENVRHPDFVFIKNENLHIVTERGIEGVPDLIGEILSPTSVKYDRKGKFETYQKFGVHEYWIIDPQNEILEQFQFQNGHYVLKKVYERSETVTSEQIQCIQISLDKIFDHSLF